jgi:RNA polymerase sigma-70 factor, ECF subfamily
VNLHEEAGPAGLSGGAVRRPDVDLATLLDRCRSGDELAWEAFVRQFQARVYGIAYHYVGNMDEARDVAQEIFVHLYEKRRIWAEPSRFVPWLVCTARNGCIDHIRRRKARPPAFDVPADEAWDLASEGGSPEELAIAKSRRGLVHRALRALTALNREVILLKDIQGLSLEEIASQLGAPIGTIKSRLNRARIELAEKVLALAEESGEGRRRPS